MAGWTTSNRRWILMKNKEKMNKFLKQNKVWNKKMRKTSHIKNMITTC